MWDAFFKKIATEKINAEKEEKDFILKIPEWLERYIEYKYNLLDRTRNNIVDIEEYEYVMQDFGVKPKEAKAAYAMFSEREMVTVDKDYFRKLYIQYFMSDDPHDPGNFITGQLCFDDIIIKYNPLVETERKFC